MFGVEDSWEGEAVTVFVYSVVTSVRVMVAMWLLRPTQVGAWGI